MRLVSRSIICYTNLFSVSNNGKHYAFIQTIHINIFTLDQNSNFIVMFKITILTCIPIGRKDQLPELSKRGYGYQTRMWLAITLCRQHSKPARLEDLLDIFLYHTLFIHIPLKLFSRNPLL